MFQACCKVDLEQRKHIWFKILQTTNKKHIVYQLLEDVNYPKRCLTCFNHCEYIAFVWVALSFPKNPVCVLSQICV